MTPELGIVVARDSAVLGAPRHAGASRTRYSRSSPADGEPRPSVLFEMNHSSPSGPAVTSRSRPSSPTNHGVAVSCPPVVAGAIDHSRSPRRAARNSVSPTIASPLGLASAVDHCATGSTNRGSPAWPSTTGHP